MVENSFSAPANVESRVKRSDSKSRGCPQKFPWASPVDLIYIPHQLICPGHAAALGKASSWFAVVIQTLRRDLSSPKES